MHRAEKIPHEGAVAGESPEQRHPARDEVRIGPRGVDAEERRVGRVERGRELAERLLQHDRRVHAVGHAHVRAITGRFDAQRLVGWDQRAHHVLECLESRLAFGQGPEVPVVDDAEVRADLAGDEHLAPSDELLGHHRADAHRAVTELEGPADAEPAQHGAASAEHRLPVGERLDHLASRSGGQERRHLDRVDRGRVDRDRERRVVAGRSRTRHASSERVNQRVSPATTTVASSPRTVRTIARKSSGSPPGVHARK